MKFFAKKIYISLIILISLLGSASSQQKKADALALYTNGKYSEAIAVCQQELVENPNNLDSYAVLCWSLVKNKQYAEAEQWANKGLKVNANDHRLIEILGEAKYYLGKNKEALNQFELYISYVPTTGSRIGAAYYYMGEIYIRQGKYHHADISLTMAVRMEPLFDGWWSRLGYAREMAGAYGTAVVAYEKALSLNAGQSDATKGLKRARARL